MKYHLLLALICVQLLGACAAAGVGVREGRQYNLAQAEPLFGAKLDKCFDDPDTLLGIAAGKSSIISKECQELAKYITPLVREAGEQSSFDVPAARLYSENLRNEIIDALIAVSNRKCGDYSAFLKTHDGQANASLSILSIITGGLGGFIGGADTAAALSGTSSILSGSRAALNDTWFSNQTIHVLVSGFQKVRERDLREITNRKDCPVSHYSVMAGVGDALQYHNACSLLTGLSEAAQAIDRSDQPGLETMRRQLADLQSISTQAEQLINASFSGDPARGLQLQDAVLTKRNVMQGDINAVRLLEARLDMLRANPPATDEDGTASDLLGQVTADLQKARSDYTVSKKEYDDAYTAFDAFQKAEAKERKDAETAGMAPKHLAGSQSRVAQCPMTGQKETKSMAPSGNLHAAGS